MAVTLTVDELSAALRLGDTDLEAAQATRLLDYAIEAVSRHLGDASYTATPSAIVNEAAIRLAAYLFDAPTASSGMTYANALRNSGAAVMLLPYRVHRAGITTTDEDAPVTTTADGLGLALFGTAPVNVVVARQWTQTSLAIPMAPFIGLEVMPPSGYSTGIEIVSNILPDDDLVTIGAAYTFPGGQQWAVGRSLSGMAFTSKDTGVHTLTVYRIGGA